MLSNCEIRKRLTGSSKVKGGTKWTNFLKKPTTKKAYYCGIEKACDDIQKSKRQPIIQQNEPIIPAPSAYVADRPPMKNIPKSSNIPVAPPLPPPAEIIEDAVEKLSLKEVLKLNRKLNEGKKLNKTDEAELGKDDHMNLLLDAIKNPKLKKAKKRDVAPLQPRKLTPQEQLMEELRRKIPKKDLEEAVEVGEGLWTKKGLFCFNKQGRVICVPPSRFNPFNPSRSGVRRKAVKKTTKKQVKKGKKKTIKRIPKKDTEKMKKQIKKEKEDMKKELEMMRRPLPKQKKTKGKVYVIETNKYYDYDFTKAQMTKKPEHYEYNKKHYFLFNTEKDRRLSLDTLKRSKKNIKYKLLNSLPTKAETKPKKTKQSIIDDLLKINLNYKTKKEQCELKIKMYEALKKDDYNKFLKSKLENIYDWLGYGSLYEATKKKLVDRFDELIEEYMFLEGKKMIYECREPKPAKKPAKEAPKEEEINDIMKAVMELDKLSTTEPVPYSSLSVLGNLFLLYTLKLNKNDCAIKVVSKGKSEYVLFLSFKNNKMINMNVEQMKEIINSYERCKKEGKILIIPISLKHRKGGHRNLLVLNYHRKEAERFEPHGAKTGSKNYDDEKINAGLEEFVMKLNLLGNLDLKYVPATETCPTGLRGFQSYEAKALKKTKTLRNKIRIGDYHGYCMAWSNFYSDLRLKFPKKSAREINDNALKVFKKDPEKLRAFIRGQVLFMEKEFNKLLGGEKYIRIINIHNKKRKTKTEKQYLKQVLIELNEKIEKEYIKFTEAKEAPKEEPKEEPEFLEKLDKELKKLDKIKLPKEMIKEMEKLNLPPPPKKKKIKKEPKEEPKEEANNNIRNEEELKRFFDNYKDFKSARQQARVKKILEKITTKDNFEGLMNLLVSSKRYNDFFPTPQSCLDSEMAVNEIKRANHIYEPTAGLGSLIYGAYKINPNVKISANELMKDNADFIKHNFPNCKTTTEDFLKMDVKPNDYDLYLLNPPFTKGGDKRFYLNFLFKALEFMDNYKYNDDPRMIFFAPPMTERKDREEEVGDLIDLVDLRNVSNKKKLELYNEYKGEKLKKLTNDEFENLIYEDLPILQIQVIDTCKFQTTGTKVNVYLIIGTRDPSKPARPDVMGSGCCNFCEEDVSGGDMAELLEDIRKGKKLNKKQEEIIKKSPNTIMDAVKERLKSIRKDVDDTDDDEEFYDDEELTEEIPQAPPLPVDEEGFIKDDKVLEPSIPQRIPQAPPIPQSIPQAPPLPLPQEEPEPMPMEEPEQPIPQPPIMTQTEPEEREDMFYTYQGTFIYDNDAMDLKNAFTQGLKDYYGGLLMDYGGYMENYKNDIIKDNVRNRHIQLMNVRNNYGY
jgi:hypothetical protein